jgi:CAAX protease family protein
MHLAKMFINDAGRLRSGWRLLTFVGLFIAIFFLLNRIVLVALAILFNVAPQTTPSETIQDLVFRFIYLLAALLAGYLCGRWLEGLPFRALGASLHEHWFRHFAIGSLIGMASLTLAVAIATAGGGLSFTIPSSPSVATVVQTLLVSAFVFVVAAFAEEAMFRGYPLQTLTRAHLASLGILINFIFFAAAHLNNPNWVLLGAFNTGLAGVWFAVAYLRSRSLWFPTGIHWAWNWTLGSLFGLPVSGITSFSRYPLLKGYDSGPSWLTGGSYGIEGGIAGTIALALATLVIWRIRLVSPTEEMLRLTSNENPVREERLSILPENQSTDYTERSGLKP